MLSASCGVSRPQAETALRKHLGVVYDICHQAVEFEDITQSLNALRRAGIPVMKLQAAAAVRIPEVSRDAIETLRKFDDPVYLHQTVQMGGAPRKDFLDLPVAFESWMAKPVQCEWRTHFHVPVFLEDLGRSRQQGLRSRRLWHSTEQIRCLPRSRSKPIRGMCCPSI
jgi:hypothetical protein